MNARANILIIYDDISQCKTMAFILGHKGYAVTTAQDGPEAIIRVQENPFEVIFMDIKMSLMDGVETYRRIKKIRSEVVMMMTACAMEDLVQEALEEGVYGVLYKPLDRQGIFRLITEILERKQKT